MKKTYPLIAFTSLAVIILLLAGCGETGSKKIPVTTSSSEAKELYLKGRDLTDKLRNNESIEFFAQAIEKDPDFAMAYLNSAFVDTTFQGFFDKLNRAAALMDKVSEGEKLWIMSVVAATNADPMKQRGYLQKLVELYPEDERGLNLLGNYYFGQQEYQKAIELYEKAIAINPEFSQPYNQLGYSYRFLYNYEDAETAFKKYIELIPDDPNPYDSYAELLMKMGKFDESIEYYRKALSVNPEFTASYLGIASNFNFKGDHESARKELQVLHDNAVNAGQRRNALFGMAVSYVDEGKMKEGISQIEKQYEIAVANNNDKPAMANDLANIGNILYEMGKYDEALKKYEGALQAIREADVGPEVKANAERIFLYNSGRIALKKGDMEIAKEKSKAFTEQVMALNNAFQIWLAHEFAGMIALAEKDHQKALAEFEQANQQNPYTFYRMGLAYQGIGEKEKAKEMFAKAAGFNQVNNMNQSFIRIRAEKMYGSL